MNTAIEYRLTKDLPWEEVLALYRGEGWVTEEETPESLIPMMRNSFAVYAAFSGSHLAGFMRSLSDGVSDAYLLDLVVDPAFRKQGIGRNLVNGLSAYLTSLGIDWVTCIGAPGTAVFYQTTDMGIMQDHIPYRYSGKTKH